MYDGLTLSVRNDIRPANLMVSSTPATEAGAHELALHVRTLVHLALAQRDVCARAPRVRVGVTLAWPAGVRASAVRMRVSLVRGVHGADAQDDDDGYRDQGQAAGDGHQDPEDRGHRDSVPAGKALVSTGNIRV